MIPTHTGKSTHVGRLSTPRELRQISGNDELAVRDTVELNTRVATEGTVGVPVGPPKTGAARAVDVAFGRNDKAQATGVAIGVACTVLGTIAVAIIDALRRK